MSTPAHPQSNGQSERAIRTTLQMLRAYVQPDGSDWEQHLSACEFAYNNAQQSSTELAPFEVLLGRRPRVPLDSTILPSTAAHGHNAAPSPEADAFLARLHDNLTRARGALHRATARQKHHADTHRRASDIKQGDQVLIDATHFGPRDHKLAPLSLGPFHVIQRQGNVLTVTLPHHLNRRHNKVNISLATRYEHDAANMADTSEPQYFDVKKVLDLRQVHTGGHGRPRMQALCKWRGESWGRSSWTSDLSTMRRMVQQHKQRGVDPEDMERIFRDDPA